MKSKQIVAVILAGMIAVSMSGCNKKSKGPTYLDANGNIPSYDITQAADGYYLLKAEDHKAYQGFMAGYVDDNHFWLVKAMEPAIPTLTSADQLIVKNQDSRPSSFKFIKFIDYGYTVGTNFQIIQDSSDIKSPTIITFGADKNPSSPVGQYISSRLQSKSAKNGVSDNVKITEINNKAFKASMLTDSGYLKGLTQDAMYKFTYYEGTYYKEMVLKADSHLFLADTTYNSSSYSEMQEDGNYFIIKLPSSLDSGYYYLENFGLFKYEAPENGLGGDIKKVIDDGDGEEIPDDNYIDYGVQGQESETDESAAEDSDSVTDDASGGTADDSSSSVDNTTSSSSIADDNTSNIADDNTSNIADDNTSSIADDNTSSIADDNTSSIADDNTSSIADDNTSSAAETTAS